MNVRILDLDGGVSRQQGLGLKYKVEPYPLRNWGPDIRLGCGFGRFRRFEQALADHLDSDSNNKCPVYFVGSGDFHHVSLALVRRQKIPFNLLILDNHPDWMLRVPFLHCGTWVYHAARLPQVVRIFHLGGDVDFDNYYLWMAPWKTLRAGRIAVFPSRRTFKRGPWAKVANQPLRTEPSQPVSLDRVRTLIHPFRSELAKHPLYVSLDKDVMVEKDAVVNWDSGHLTLPEVSDILTTFLEYSEDRLLGMDVVGDWSPVKVNGLLRRFLHLTEHPGLAVEPEDACRRNEATNLVLLEKVRSIFD